MSRAGDESRLVGLAGVDSFFLSALLLITVFPAACHLSRAGDESRLVGLAGVGSFLPTEALRSAACAAPLSLPEGEVLPRCIALDFEAPGAATAARAASCILAGEVLPRFSGLGEVLSRFSGLGEVLLRFSGLGEVLPRFSGVGEVLPRFSGLGEVLPRFSGVGEVLPRFSGLGFEAFERAASAWARLTIAFASSPGAASVRAALAARCIWPASSTASRREVAPVGNGDDMANHRRAHTRRRARQTYPQKRHNGPPCDAPEMAGLGGPVRRS